MQRIKQIPSQVLKAMDFKDWKTVQFLEVKLSFRTPEYQAATGIYQKLEPKKIM